MKMHLLAAVAAFALLVPVAAEEAKPAPSPGEIVAAAPASDWTAIAASDLLVMDLAPGARGPRRVVIQLMPAPFSQGWIGNIRKLAAARWWDGTSVNRVQDNYVVQWGDATEKKALPEGLMVVGQENYVSKDRDVLDQLLEKSGGAAAAEFFAEEAENAAEEAMAATGASSADGEPYSDRRVRDPYASHHDTFFGWLIAGHRKDDGYEYWPVHCYAMVGVGRNLSPDTGSGAELYTVIGHAPRHLDRNIALVGRVIEGIEHLSSLPRGTGALGFYEKEEERVPILSVRIGTDIADLPAFEYLSTESATFAQYADARANRRDPFFNVPAGGADICNIPVPVRRRP
ncbi:MAG: peptidylprolyl isomerase [Sphingopyxis sp.]|nr:peptidylprolyl isomerase [Sphingopyxis sp.]